MTHNLVVMVSLKWTIWLNCGESNLSNKVEHAYIHKCKHLYPHVWCRPTLNGPNSSACRWADGLRGVKYRPVIYVKLRIYCHVHIGMMYVLILCVVLCRLEQKQGLRGMKHLYGKHTDALIWLFWVLWIYFKEDGGIFFCSPYTTSQFSVLHILQIFI